MTTPLFTGADASDPTSPPPPGTDLICGYVGRPGVGAPDTPHIWTPDEWNTALTAAPGSRPLPIATHSYDSGDPVAAGWNAVESCEALGWAPGKPAPDTRIILIDCEVLVDPDYFTAMQEEVRNGGFLPVLYGSSFFVRQNPSPYGYWDALYTARPPTVLPPHSIGVQWHPGGAWDLSVFGEAAYLGAGVGLRTS